MQTIVVGGEKMPVPSIFNRNSTTFAIGPTTRLDVTRLVIRELERRALFCKDSWAWTVDITISSRSLNSFLNA